MKRIVFLIALTLSGCSQTREKRREAVTKYFQKQGDAPVSNEPLLSGWVQDRVSYQNWKAGDLH
jgi:hypothetical protein